MAKKRFFSENFLKWNFFAVILSVETKPETQGTNQYVNSFFRRKF